MSANFHTHTVFCDGKATPEEIVKRAIELGFSSIGFSGHGYTPYDLRYCMKDIIGYITEVERLRRLYKDKIEIYLGIEEDSRHLCHRADLDYIIGSCHYYETAEGIFPFDSNYSFFTKGLSAYGGNELLFAEDYYRHFCDYILRRRPDIIGHFDLVTKFDEKEKDRYLHNPKYNALAIKYTRIALGADCIFEVNTGLMTRGFRTSPCPHENLLYEIKKQDGKIILSSDSHQLETLDGYFEETRAQLRDIGFEYTYTLKDRRWVKEYL